MKFNRIFIAAMIGLLFFSCSKDFKEINSYEGDNAYYFQSESISVLENIGMPIEVIVYFTTKDGSEGTVDFVVSSDELILEEDYAVLTSGPLLFNEENGWTNSIEVSLVDNDEFTGGVSQLEIELTNPTNGDVGFSGPDNLRSTTVINVQDDDCPSRNVAGSYTVTATGQSTDSCCPDPASLSGGTVDIVDNGDNTWTIFDWTGGLYGFWYEQFGVTPEYIANGGLNATISVICDDFTAEFTEPFNTTATISGKVNQETGIITYDWTNGFDDTGNVVLTPQ